MKILKISLIIGLLCITCEARPTFDVIGDIIHDLVHDPNQPGYHHKPPPQYVHNGPYTQHGYHQQPGYTQVGGTYGYHQRPLPQGGRYSHNAGYYPPNNHQGGYYPPNGAGGYGSNAIYDNQGYYKGPPYPAGHANGYNYNSGYTNPGPQYSGYKSRGY